MPVLYRSLSGSSRETKMAYSQCFSRLSLSSSLKKSSYLCLVEVVSISFFISNMMDTISVPESSLPPVLASLTFSK